MPILGIINKANYSEHFKDKRYFTLMRGILSDIIGNKTVSKKCYCELMSVK